MRVFSFFAASLMVSGSFLGCASQQYDGRGHVLNDSRHNAAMLTQTILVPGVPYKTKQNALFQIKDKGGRNFLALVGPFPFDSAKEAEVVTHNTVLTFDITSGFALLIGKQPLVTTRTGTGASDGTHFIVWADTTTGIDYYFVEESTPGWPVNITPMSGVTSFAPVAITTGQYVAIKAGDTKITPQKYFDPAVAGSALVATLPADVAKFVTYARSRGVAAGLVKKEGFFLGDFETGIPATPAP